MSNEIILREVEAQDLPIFFEQQMDPEATRMAAFPLRERDAFMAHWQKIMNNPSGSLRTILFETQVAGNIVSWVQDGEHEVGYWLGKDYWGKGIATGALSKFLNIVKERPLFAHVARHNIASRRVLEKCGFELFRHEKFESRGGIEETDADIYKLDMGQ
jgi:RimJ/RimL family protein N-acetyltransferase